MERIGELPCHDKAAREVRRNWPDGGAPILFEAFDIVMSKQVIVGQSLSFARVNTRWTEGQDERL